MKIYRNLKYNDDFTICYGPEKDVKYPHFHKNTKVIVENAFKESKVRILKFPKNLVEIKERAFMQCVDIKKIKFSKNLHVIGSEAFFMSKTDQRKIALPDNLLCLEDRSLSSLFARTVILPKYINCLNNIPRGNYVISDKNRYFSCVNGDIYSKDYTSLYKKASTHPILEGCKVIKSGAFTSFLHFYANITLPETVERIEGGAFCGAYLNSLSLPKNASLKIGDSAFEYMCLSNPLVLHDNIETSCENIASLFRMALINFTTDSKNLLIENNVLYSSDKSKLIFYPYNKTEETFTIPNEVKEICRNAFNSINKLQTLIIDSKEKVVFREFAIKDCRDLKEIIFKSPVVLKSFSLSGNNKIKKIDLPSTSIIEDRFMASYMLEPRRTKVLIDERDYNLDKINKSFFEEDYEVHLKNIDFYIDQNKSFKEINNMYKKNHKKD